MNLRNTTCSREETSINQPWYVQPETTVISSVQDATAENQAAQALSSRSQTITYFDPVAAERILARAAALQEVHGQMLSREQIEAIAAEIGIKPEFVSLAIEQEGSEVTAGAKTSRKMLRRPRSREDRLARLQVAVTTAAYGAFTLVTMAAIRPLQRSQFGDPLSDLIIPATVFYLPSLLALCIGSVGRRRRSGILSGAALAVTVILTATLGSFIGGNTRGIQVQDLPFFSMMIAAGAVLGLAGAQGQRVVSRRRARRQRERVQTGASGKSA